MHYRLTFAILAFGTNITMCSSADEIEAIDFSQNASHVAAATTIGSGLTALVAGDAGFVGRHVAMACLKLGFARVILVDNISNGYKHYFPEAVQFLQGDVENSSFVESLLLKTKAHVVYSLSNDFCHYEDTALDGRGSNSTCTNLFRAGVNVGSVQRFVFVMLEVANGNSSHIYEANEPRVLDRFRIATKGSEEADLAATYATPKVSSAVFQLNDVYGPGMDLISKPNTVARFMNQLRAKEGVGIDGYGPQIQHLTFISDISHAIALSGFLPEAANQALDMVSSLTITASDLAQACTDAWNNAKRSPTDVIEAKLQPKHKLQPQDRLFSGVSGQKVPEAGSRTVVEQHEYLHAESHYHFEEHLPLRTPLNDGLERTARWMLRHINTDRFSHASSALHNVASTTRTSAQSFSDPSLLWGINRDEVGFYLQVFKERESDLAQMLSGVRYFYPCSPVFLFSDHGDDYSTLCDIYNCTFVMEPSSINVDLGRAPHAFTCEKFIDRVLRAIDASGPVRYFFYWEADVRAIGPLKHAPPSDMMQMFSVHNHWSPVVKASLDDLFPHTQGRLLGWSSTGGTLFDASKLAAALHAQSIPTFFKSERWKAMASVWTKHMDGVSIPDRTSDGCLAGTALVAGLTIGEWFEYGEIKRMNGDLRHAPWKLANAGEKCNRCIHACLERHPNSTASWAWKINNFTALASVSHPWPTYPLPPAVDLCIFQDCGAKALCPAIVHDMKTSWNEYEPVHGWPN